MIISNENNDHVDHKTNTNNNTKESKSNMAEMTTNIPFSIPFPGMDYNRHDNWAQNPFIYLLFLWMFGNGGFGNNWGRGGFGGPGSLAAGAAMEATSMTASQVDDIRSKVSEIAAEVACGNRSLSGLQTACDALGLRIDNLKDLTLSTLNTIGRQLDQNAAATIAKIQECCCATGERICGVEKEMLRQGNAMTQGFASLGYLSEKNTNAITQTISNESCVTRQLIQQLHNEDMVARKDIQISELKNRLDNANLAAQTQTIINALKPATTTTTA